MENRGSRVVLLPLAIFVVLVAPAFATPAAAQTVIPAEGAQLNYIHVRFSWAPDSSATQYQLQVVETGSDADPFATGSPVVDRLTGSIEPHSIVQAGLRFGRSYAWRVRSMSAAGAAAWSSSHRFSTLPLPAETTTMTVTRGPSTHPPEPGLTLFVLGTAWAVDVDGNIVWFLPQSGADVRVLKNGNISYIGIGKGWELTLDGRVLWQSPDDPTLHMHHELFPMPNGNYLTVVREFRDVERAGKTEKWLGDAIVEINPCTDEVVWSWSTFDHFSTKDFDTDEMREPLSDGSYDWTHGNAAVYDERTNSIYASWRHLSRITRIDYATRRVVYNMGMTFPSGHVHFGDDFFSFQHAPQLLPNGNMIVFDNGNRRKNPPQPLMSKAIEIAFSGGSVPTSAKIVWEWTLPEYVEFAGQATRLPGGTTLVTTSDSRKIYEVDPAGQLVWTLAVGNPPKGAGRALYRAERVPSLFTGSGEASLDRCARR